MKTLLPGILAMAAIVVASNILVQFPIGQYLTWGAFSYPFAFLVTELVNRFHGPATARRVVYAGFAVGVACSLAGAQVMTEFGPLVTFRVAVGSGLAFLASQLLDVAVFDRLRRGSWWKGPLLASVLASCLDTVIFFSLAFSASFTFLHPATDVSWATEAVPLLGFGAAVPFWVSLATADWLVKLSVDLAALLPFRLAVAKYASRFA